MPDVGIRLFFIGNVCLHNNNSDKALDCTRKSMASAAAIFSVLCTCDAIRTFIFDFLDQSLKRKQGSKVFWLVKDTSLI